MAAGARPAAAGPAQLHCTARFVLHCNTALEQRNMSPVLHVATSAHAAPPRRAKGHRGAAVTVHRGDGGNGGVAAQAAGSARRPLLEGADQALDQGSWRASLADRASGVPEAPPDFVNDGQCPGRHAAAPPRTPAGASHGRARAPSAAAVQVLGVGCGGRLGGGGGGGAASRDRLHVAP